MDSPLVVPRLRLTRQHPRARIDNVFEMPQAGPSRISTQMDTLNVHQYEDEDDNQSTPRVAAKPQLENALDGTAPENYVHRLRHALSLNPSESARSAPRKPPSPTYSDMESDFEPPNMTTNATEASIAKESLKELFDRMRHDTPQKDRRKERRNSIDLSEVEASPRIELVLRERAKNKGKRRSMSDEEAEKSSSMCHPYIIVSHPYMTVTGASEVSFKSTSAVTYDALRQRLASAVGRSLSTNIGDPVSESGSEMDGPAEQSGDTATTFKHFEMGSGSFAPPVGATSTPLRSLQMPSEIQMQSSEKLFLAC